MKTVHVIDLAYQIDGMSDDENVTMPWGRYDDILDELATKCQGQGSSGGTGFGCRDGQFEFKSRNQAKKFRKLITAHPDINTDEFEYISYYTER